MTFPEFFDDVPAIAMRDPLAELLGAAENGRIEYRYVDAVKLAGHSCPTVASAWLMTARALAALYPDPPPERGNIRVELRGAQDDGVEGVIALIAGSITGAAGPGGFKGIAGRHARRGLLEFGAPIRSRIRFTRLDTQRAIEVDYRAEHVPMPPDMRPLLAAATVTNASDAARRAFGDHWQAWVRTILVDRREDPQLIQVREARAGEPA
ncbi:MAG: hypothetical protein ACM3PU_09855 [Gemmatimonadota bacterium]